MHCVDAFHLKCIQKAIRKPKYETSKLFRSFLCVLETPFLFMSRYISNIILKTAFLHCMREV